MSDITDKKSIARFSSLPDFPYRSLADIELRGERPGISEKNHINYDFLPRDEELRFKIESLPDFSPALRRITTGEYRFGDIFSRYDSGRKPLSGRVEELIAELYLRSDSTRSPDAFFTSPRKPIDRPSKDVDLPSLPNSEKLLEGLRGNRYSETFGQLLRTKLDKE